MDGQTRQFWNDTIARRVGISLDEFIVVVFNGLRYLQHQLGYVVTLLCLYVTVGLTHHMKYHIIIVSITFVAMLIPV